MIVFPEQKYAIQPHLIAFIEDVSIPAVVGNPGVTRTRIHMQRPANYDSITVNVSFDEVMESLSMLHRIESNGFVTCPIPRKRPARSTTTK